MQYKIDYSTSLSYLTNDCLKQLFSAKRMQKPKAEETKSKALKENINEAKKLKFNEIEIHGSEEWKPTQIAFKMMEECWFEIILQYSRWLGETTVLRMLCEYLIIM